MTISKKNKVGNIVIIEKFNIQNFRSIFSTGEINLDKNVTVLIGKNEQGKTNVLKALESINTKYSYEDIDLCFNHETTKVGEKIPIITVWFKLNDNEKSKLSKLDDRLANIGALKLIKYFDNSYDVFIDDKLIGSEDVDNTRNIEELCSKTKESLSNIVDSAISEIKSENRSVEQSNIDYIINFKKGDGGFGPGKEDHSRTDTTYFAIEALNEYNALDLIYNIKVTDLYCPRNIPVEGLVFIKEISLSSNSHVMR